MTWKERASMLESGDWLRETPAATRLIFQGDRLARAAAAREWAPGFATTACRATQDGGRASLWLGPDEFLLLAPANTDYAALRSALRNSPHSLVDVSHRQIGLEVSGPHSVERLSGGCALDLDESQFPVGMCTRTLFAKADIVLWRTGTQTFHLEVWRSFVHYTTEILREIARC
jgi:sarcosine oxidase, subunit gamma